ncbi:K02A2.6-like [Cordylochernes scorpioides]|uniref:RNA-directed DNA polymerase n=1 Tax=Cordylochernes scorpioides TaxID=51811 RepID=A0ABY6JV34_9ARAC|nr:K02A2.6-like [Cordylochernes scorpioides]
MPLVAATVNGWQNPRTTLLELEKDTSISKITIGKIVTEDLKLKKIPAKCIPRFLTNEQNLCRLATCEDMFKMTRTDPEWKDKIITGDETWVYGYDPETKRQSAEWRGQGEPRPKKSRILKSRNKVLLVAFLDNKGIVHHEYLPAGQTVIKEMYLSILRRLREAIRKKRPMEKWTNGDWILHHDNARPHTAHLVTSFLAKNGTEILPQPPYSPDIAPNDFFLFPKLKEVLKGRHFDTREDIIEKSLLALKSIPKEAYKNCFDNWEKRWRWFEHVYQFQTSRCSIRIDEFYGEHCQVYLNNLHEFRYCSFAVEELFLEVYKRVFENKDLPIQGIKGSISLRPNAKPKFFKFRPVPFSIKEKIDKELDRLEKSQIIEKVNASDWSTPLVTVIKSNGELRLCGDFKNTLNNCIEDEKYPLPTIETMLGNLGGNKIFTKLDLSSAYHQIEMDEASKNLLVVSTHRGLYRYNRLPFGISPASAIFQRCMDSLFHDVPNTVIYLDDIFIGSKDEQEHYRILKMIFDKLKELNFTLNKEKCLFLKKDICFLGHIINEDGVRPDSKKLEALERCKKPFDKTSLKSFLGMLSFYSKYIPNMSTLAGPLYQLLKKDNRWKWSSQCEKAFLNLKLTLLNSQALIHYSMKLPLTLTCDASAYGISGVLCHIVEGEEKPITFVSRTLSSAEVKYSQTEKEALAIVFATSKLRQYLFGRKFVLKSDHKALTTVFGNKRLLPPLIANRLHRWALELSNFDFDIRYTNKDTMLCADAFSRLPLEEINSREDNIDLVTHDISFLNVTPLDHLIIEEETNKDPVLNKLKEYLLEDPQLAKKDETMKPFLSKLENFSVLQGCIFVDSRAVIPRTCQDQMLKLLHQSHIGINRMKSLARSSVWWPKMDSQIEEFVKECSPCMHHQTAPPAENTPWPRTNQPWQRVHVDHFYFRGDCYLLVVDANSNWIEVFQVRGTTSQENIKLLRECFARYGLPQCLVSDNGPPFNSIEFKEFLRKNNVYHLTSPAYNPSSNGIAEVSVRIIKKSLEKSLEESPNSNMDCILQNVLFNYRNTPTSLDKPPVERLLSYVPRTFVNCLNSEFIQKTFGRNECGRRHFQVGDKVLFTRVIQNRRKWFKAQVIRRLGYNVYLVKNLKGTFKVHVNQMRTGSDTKYAEDSDWTLDNAGAGPHRLEQDPQISTSPPPRRSTRPRCPPCRFSPTMNNIRKEE